MLLEDILLAVVIGVVLLLVVWPAYRLVKTATPEWRRRDPLAEAKARLKAAQTEAEAARIHREADRIYEKLYDDTLADGEEAGVEDQERAEAVEPPGEKGNRNG
jgi:TPP-dependent pyruvate/acetoin dehydrogenase alpha subunit